MMHPVIIRKTVEVVLGRNDRMPDPPPRFDGKQYTLKSRVGPAEKFMASRRRLSVLAFAPLPLLTAATAPDYAGAAACAKCHPAQFAAQSRSAHAKALAPSKPPQSGLWAFGAGL